MMSVSPPLPAHQWLLRKQNHEAALADLISKFRARRDRGEVHPVHDFLFTYYPFPPGRLERWHPSFGETLQITDPEDAALFPQKYYQHRHSQVMLDPSLLGEKDIARLHFSLSLLQATANRTPNFGCHGLHEWAMIYRSSDIRHRERAPLRLSEEEIARFLDSQPLVCSHFDAFRFFTPQAAPRNRLKPSLETRASFEQPGCIHANMDLYKWSFKAMPWVGSDFLRKTFFLALALRELDMRASPYDLTAYGYDAIPIESESGRAAYVKSQQQLATQSAQLRDELISILRKLLSSLGTQNRLAPSDPTPSS